MSTSLTLTRPDGRLSVTATWPRPMCSCCRARDGAAVASGAIDDVYDRLHYRAVCSRHGRKCIGHLRDGARWGGGLPVSGPKGRLP